MAELASPPDRFMVAFIAIEQHMKKSLYGGRSESPGRFRQMVEEYAAKGHLRDSQRQTLFALADLRNLLAHTRLATGRPVAEPSEGAVEAIERIRDELLHPPAVLGVLRDPKPALAHPEDAVGATLQVMYEHDFSQMPVYEDDRYVGLLTTNTVARWVADQMREHEGLAEDAPVREALAFAEGYETVLHRPRTLSVPDTVSAFAHAAERGTPITALIVTQNGRRDETPLGIVVAEDLARLSQ